MKFRFFLIFIAFFSLAARADGALKFKNWREQQILEAQNELLRISARLHQQKANPKADTTATTTGDEMPNPSRFERAPEVTDKDLKNAQESLTAARELTLEDYADVYITNLKEQDPDQFSKLMDSLSKEELAQLMKILVKKTDEQPDAMRNKVLTAPVASISATHS